ncbi:MAG: PaaI family thioesterase [Acidimicrobiales bacterium]
MSDPAGFISDPDLDPAETHVGPFLRREGPDGVDIALVVGPQHCNEHGSLHGGVQMALADYTAGATARFGTTDSTVSVSFDAQFVDTAGEGDLVIGRAEVVRRTGSLVFVQGRLRCQDRPILAFNAVVKRLR